MNETLNEVRAQPTSRTQAARIPSLDGLRAVAIAFVVFAHAISQWPYGWPGHVIMGRLENVGRFGVSIFFVISGFLITTLLLREEETAGRINLRQFYLRRTFRILLPFYAFLGVVAVMAALRIIVCGPRDLLVAAAFLNNYLFTGNVWVGHSWSLAVEEQFYLTWPIFLVWLGRRRATWLAIGVVLASPMARALTYIYIPQSHGKISLMLHTRADVLMMGCLSALLFRNPKFQAALARIDRFRPEFVAPVFLLVVSPLMTARLAHRYTMLFGFSLEAAFITLGLLWAIRHPHRGPAWVLNWAPVRYVGVISYSLYLWQQVFLFPLNTTVTGRFPINLLCCFAMAILSFHLIERPSLRLRERLTGDRRPAGPGV